MNRMQNWILISRPLGSDLNCWIWRWVRIAVALSASVGLVVWSPSALAQFDESTGDSESEVAPESPPLTREQVEQLHQQALELYTEEKYSEALAVYAKILAANEGDVIALYNSACVQAKLENTSKAAKLLVSAVMAGFIDFERMENDPDLDPVRDEPEYQAVLELRSELHSAAGNRLEQLARALLGEDAIIERDDEIKLIYAVQLDRETHERLKQRTARQLRYQMKRFFDGPPNSYVLLMVPTPEKASQIIGSARVGGFYDHDNKRLVTRDLGPSLQHEITHALHHAHMDRLGQKHPMWIQEGLASIFEMYDLDTETDTLRVLDNNRINVAVNLRGVGGLTKWKKLFTLDDHRFVNVRPRARYAESRAVLQFLAEQNLLESWYQIYTENFDEDLTGRLAFEKVLGKGITEIERDFRNWIAGKSKIPEEIAESQPALGLFVADQGANDGVEIVGIHPGGAARRESILARDVITAIDGRSVYSVEEVLIEMMRRADGDEVTLHLRRGARYLDVTVKIRPVTPPRDFEFFQKPGVSV